MLAEDALVLDVGAWASPFARADWVLDLMPYETRGLYGEASAGAERFSADTWVVRDICDREPWPFGDETFDFAVCSHTLEDVRDPVWVCAELSRVAKAGYVEVPSRLEEQCLGVHGPFVGWSHHHWLIDVVDGELEVVFKPHVLHAMSAYRFPPEVAARLTAEERVTTLFWSQAVRCRERLLYESEELGDYLTSFVSQRLPELRSRIRGRGIRSRLRIGR